MDSKTFRTELAQLINAHSLEGGSNTPDFVLAEYLAECLHVFDKTIAAREKWYGRELVPVDAPIELSNNNVSHPRDGEDKG